MRTIALGVVPLTTTAIAARLGPVALGGQQVAMRVWYLLALLLDALAVPAQVYVPVAVLVLRFPRLGLPGVWVALGLWLAARAVLLGRRWQARFRHPA